MREILEMNNRLARLEKRVAQSMRHAPVKQVNAAEGWVRLDFGDGLLSPKIPYAQIAGGLKVHAPPTVGQQMTMLAPGGDPAQAVALPMTWSNQNASPSDKGDENVITFGQARIELRGSEIVVSIGGFKLTMTASAATFEVGGVKHEISGGGVDTTGGAITHDGKHIDKSHVHGGILPGPSLTGVPAN